MTSCVKCGRPVRGSGKVAHLLCQKCRAPEPTPPKGGKTHVVPSRAVRTLCGRPVKTSRVAAQENDATCQRCQQLLLVRARNQAYRVALKTVAKAASSMAYYRANEFDQLLLDALEQIAEELKLRANGQLLARPVGPEILKRAGERSKG